MTALRVAGVTYRYASGRGVAGVSFEVAAGELFGIVGPNSAGKSTLLRLLSKVLAPQAGRVSLHGRDVAAMGRLTLARELAVVPQDFQVAFPFTVREVVLMGRYPHTGGGWPGPRDRAAAEAAMAVTGVAALGPRRIDELSGGERQLVSIARALAQEPAVLLLDEPTAHLDLRHQALVLDTLLVRGDPARTTVVISHDLNLAAEHCDRLLLLAEGHTQAVGAPAEVMTADHLAEAYGCPVVVEEDPVSRRPRVRGSLPRHAVRRLDRPRT